MRTIGLLWHSFYSGNLGLSALTDAHMSIIRDALPSHEGPVKFIVFGPRGDSAFKPPEEFLNCEYVEISSIRKVRHIRNKLASCDYVFDIGSGDSFSDIYGFKRFLKIAGSKFLIPNMPDRLIISPQTFGPFVSWWSRIAAAKAFRSARRIFARDEMSLNRVMEMCGPSVSNRIDISTDVAFALKKLDEWPKNYPTLAEDKKLIGINVSGLLYSGGYTGENQFDLSLDYKELIHKILAALSVRTDVSVWLIPHVYQITTPAMESDLSVCTELTERYSNVQLAPLFYNAREAKTFISRMDIVLAARMHAAIGAVSSGIACVPMSYSVKFQGLFGGLEYPYTVDLKTLDLDTAYEKTLTAIENIDEMKVAALAASSRAIEKLKPYASYISSL